MEHHPAAKFGPFYGWECKRQLRLLDILDYWCCLPPCRSLAHHHTGCNPRPWFFCHQTWLFSGWISDPCRLQQVSCNICGDCDVIQQNIQRNPPSATFPASILLAGCGPWQKPHGFLIVFCSVLVSGHWFNHGGHFETEFDKLFWLTRGLQVIRSHGALLQWKRGWLWIFEPTNGPPEWLSCGVCLTWACQKHLQSLHIFFLSSVSATLAVDMVFSLLIISTLVSGWILGMLSEVKLQLMWRSGVLGFFLYTPKNWLINYCSQVKI